MPSKLVTLLRSIFFCALSLLATEGLAQTTIHVGPGQPYTTIQSGIDAANNGDTVLVAPGTYNENIDFKGKAITVTSSGGAASTIIDGGGDDATVVFINAEPRASTISGFTIRNGAPGVYVGAAAPTISNNIITTNICDGIYVDFSTPLIQNNDITTTANFSPSTTSKYCTGSGFGINLGGTASNTGFSGVSIIGNTIENSVDGGIANDASSATLIQSNIIRNNQGAGAIEAFNIDTIYVLDNLIYGNSAASGFPDVAGGIDIQPYGQSVGPFFGIIAGNTIAGNTVSGAETGETGEQVALSGNLAQYLVVNNVIVGSSATVPAVNCGEIYSYLMLTPLVFDHNDIYNPDGQSYGGSCTSQTGIFGNISSDPMFINPAKGDYTLHAGSPAIDAGNNSAPLLPSLDLAGSARVQDATGLGYPVVDMGAYEFAGRTNAPPTILTLTPSEYFVPPGFTIFPYAPLTFTSALSSAAGQPTGPVSIYVDGNLADTVLVGSAGSITYSLPGLKPGLHAFTSTYPGSGIFPPAISVKFYLLIPEIPTTLTLNSSLNPSLVGSPVLFTVQASAQDGTVPSPIAIQDTSTNTLLATLIPNSSGSTTYTTNNLAAGYHSIQASYAGTSTYAASSASVLQDVITGYPTATALTCQPGTISIGGTALLDATVTSSNGTPTGSIAFTDNGAPLGTQNLVNGAASLTYTGTVATTHTITATYTPTGSFAGSSASCTEVVNPLPTTSVLTVSPSTVTYGSPVTLTATVAAVPPPGPSAPAGTVTFYNGSSVLGTGSLAGGVATLAVGNLPGGTDNLTCMYGGSSIYGTSNCNSVPLTVTAAATKLTIGASQNPALALSPVTLTARLTVNGQAAGAGNTISLTIAGQTSSLTTDATGSASLTTGTLTPGSYPVAASFAGNGNLAASAASLTEVVNPIATATTLTTAPNPAYLGQTVTMVATVSPQASSATATGSVGFYDGATLLGTEPVTAGTATFSISTLSAGTHPITASFVPASNVFTGSTSPVVDEVILPSGFTIALSPATITLAQGATGTAAIQLASVGSFAGPLALSYGSLPQYATASIAPATVTLAPGGGGSSTLTLNTLLNASNSLPARPWTRELSPALAGVLLFFVPLGIARRHRIGRLLGLALCAVALGAMTGCTNAWHTENSVAAGTYQVAVTATDVNHNSQTATLTVVVTP